MSDPKSNSGKGSTKGVKRNLPSWMSGSDNGGGSQTMNQTSYAEEGDIDKGEKSKQTKGFGKGHVNIESSMDSKNNERCSASASSTTNFSKLLEGVVFVLSGFVNPERSILRSQALEMGAEYQADWNSDCTLLICAFPNTPKFRQVEADCGTIVSKEWISECYKKKKLVDIESYLLHVGKPWRRSNSSFAASQVAELNVSPSPKPQKFVGKSSHSESNNNRALSKSKASNPISEFLSHSDVKKWAMDDLCSTISWLESQAEKPEPDEMKEIAAEGILTCLQDAIDSLRQKQDIHQMTDEWKFVPRVVRELAKLKGTEEDLCKQAMMCRDIYETELRNGPRRSPERKKNSSREEKAGGYESDETIEMTEEEIDTAFNSLTSKSKNAV